jgi:iron-sulfur cluster assembly accessory protein
MTVSSTPAQNQTAAARTGVSMTARAAQRINSIVAADAGARLMRVSVEGGGCSGFQYKFELTDTAEADDLRIERDGATVVVDPVSVVYMLGSEIDFVDDLIGASFKIDNPNATASCGCGTSFTI